MVPTLFEPTAPIPSSRTRNIHGRINRAEVKQHHFDAMPH